MARARPIGCHRANGSGTDRDTVSRRPRIEHQIAQLNVARAVAPLGDPRLADFMALLDEVNRLAERSPGFVWRLQGESGNATDWQPAGTIPTIEDAFRRLQTLMQPTVRPPGAGHVMCFLTHALPGVNNLRFVV